MKKIVLLVLFIFLLGTINYATLVGDNRVKVYTKDPSTSHRCFAETNESVLENIKFFYDRDPEENIRPGIAYELNICLSEGATIIGVQNPGPWLEKYCEHPMGWNMPDPSHENCWLIQGLCAGIGTCCGPPDCGNPESGTLFFLDIEKDEGLGEIEIELTNIRARAWTCTGDQGHPVEELPILVTHEKLLCFE